MEDKEFLRKKAIRRAMHLLERMDRTEKSLRDKLSQSDYPEEFVEEAIQYVKSYGYVDDDRFAENYIRNRLETKSRVQLMQALYRKGIGREVFQRAWDAVVQEQEPDERSLIRSLVRKKCGDKRELSETEYRRLQNYLARRGFAWGEVAAVFEEEQINTRNSSGRDSCIDN